MDGDRPRALPPFSRGIQRDTQGFPQRVEPVGITFDAPAAHKIVIPGLVPSISAGDGFDVLPSITETCAAGDPRVTHEDDDGGVS